MQFYQINAGHLAVDNGSVAPLSALFALGDILDQKKSFLASITGKTS
jgi:hypothetical protein